MSYRGSFIFVLGALATPAWARQCDPEWSLGFGRGDLDDYVEALAVYDFDGPGGNAPRLFAGGWFHTAGGVSVNYFASWDGSAWSAHEPAMTHRIHALTVFDEDGAGPIPESLYAGGVFTGAGNTATNRVARWDGQSWHDMAGGVNATVYALEPFDDDGSGPAPPALFVGGAFTTAGTGAANRVAKWTGTSWQALGAGLDGTVRDLAAFDDDGGGPNPPALFAAGDFLNAGGGPAARIGRWDGTAWAAMGAGANAPVADLIVADIDGPGGDPAALFAGGQFTSIGGVAANRVARWNGTTWSALGLGVSGEVYEFDTFDQDGSGPMPPNLCAAGEFLSAGGASASRIALWNGSTWSALGSGAATPVIALEVFDSDGDGPKGAELYAGGSFQVVGGLTVNYIGKWSGATWSALAEGMDNSIYAFTPADLDGPGPQPAFLYAAGTFELAGGARGNSVARWTGSRWEALGTGLGGFPRWGFALRAGDIDGPGPQPTRLYVGGQFATAGGVPAASIAAWTGTSWQAVGGNVNPGAAVFALELFDEDGAGPGLACLFAGGEMTSIAGVPVAKIARWNGTAWSPVGGGFTAAAVGHTPTLFALTFHDDGGGPALYAGGGFTEVAGTTTAHHIARWDGNLWAPVGSGTALAYFDGVYALAVHDGDGAGPEPTALYAGGRVVGNGACVAKWDGSQWAQMTGVAGWVRALHSANVGEGPSLYAGGQVLVIGGNDFKRIGRWDGAVWHPLASGMSDDVYGLGVFDDDGPGPATPALYAGGTFLTAGGVSSKCVARWACPINCYPDCNEDGALTVADFGCYQTRFVAADPYADCNWDGALTVADFGCFQTKFVAGCP